MARTKLTRPSTEGEKQFFSDYLPLATILLIVGIVCQLFSGTTESILFYLNSYEMFEPITGHRIAHIIGIVFTALGLTLIEGGLFVLLPYSIRSVIKGWINPFHSSHENKKIGWSRCVIGVFSIASCSGLIFFSAMLSFNGSEKTVDAIATEYVGESTDSLNNIFQTQIAAVNQQFSKDSLRVATEFEVNKLAISAGFDSQIKSVRNSVYQLARKEKNEGVSYATKKARLMETKANIEGNKTAALMNNDKEKRDALRQLKEDRKEDIAEIKGTTGGEIAYIQQENKSNESAHNSDIKGRGKSLGWFVVCAIFVLCVTQVVREIHMNASGINQINLPTDFYFRQSLLAAWKQAIGERVEGVLRRELLKFTQKTQNPSMSPTPAIGYQSDEKEELEGILYDVKYVNGVDPHTEKREIEYHLDTPQTVFYGSRHKNDTSRNDGSRRTFMNELGLKLIDRQSNTYNDTRRNVEITAAVKGEYAVLLSLDEAKSVYTTNKKNKASKEPLPYFDDDSPLNKMLLDQLEDNGMSEYVYRFSTEESRNDFKAMGGGVRLKQRKGYMINNCQSCGKEYHTKSHNSKFCKDPCTRQENYLNRKLKRGEKVSQYLVNKHSKK